ncbi:MAG: hypothetical protein IKX56_05560 [Muribaculaceae bacterium]|nr:hypothetical protein [Muribaculaceae bacterium]
MDWVQLTGYLISPLMAAAGWIVGTRLRRVNAVTHMQEAVDRLTEKNKEYINELVVIRRELAEVRAENAELKLGQEKMTAKISELQTENRQLMARLNEQLNKGRGDGHGEH